MALGRSRFKKSSSSSSSSIGIWQIANWAIRFLQFIFAIVVIGLYAQDLNKAHKEHKYTDSKWGYAVAVGALSAFTAMIYCIPKIPVYWAFGWDFVLFILWCAVMGIFGKLYIHENPEGDGGIKRMKNAVWIDLINLLLWFISGCFALAWFFLGRGGRSLHTGRATA